MLSRIIVYALTAILLVVSVKMVTSEGIRLSHELEVKYAKQSRVKGKAVSDFRNIEAGLAYISKYISKSAGIANSYTESQKEWAPCEFYYGPEDRECRPTDDGKAIISRPRR